MRQFDMMDNMGSGSWAMLFGPLYMLVGVAAIVVVIIFVLRSLGLMPGRYVEDQTSRDILDQRYARGEIDDEEYARRRKVLDS